MKILSLLMSVDTDDSLKFIARDIEQELNSCTNHYDLIGLTCIDITNKTIQELKIISD